jgi:hypothetical protein
MTLIRSYGQGFTSVCGKQDPLAWPFALWQFCLFQHLHVVIPLSIYAPLLANARLFYD